MDANVVFGKVLYGMDVVYKIEAEGKRVVYPKERLSFQMVNLVCDLSFVTSNC
jgi:cyclophilin family peptidyl-prolyl cis-trans isomerase